MPETARSMPTGLLEHQLVFTSTFFESGYFLHHGPLSNPGSARFPQHGHARDLRRDLLEELKPLSGSDP